MFKASSVTTTIKSTPVLKVNLVSGGKKGGGRLDLDNDNVHLPGTFDDPSEAMYSLTNGIESLPTNFEFQGPNPGVLLGQGHSQSFVANPGHASRHRDKRRVADKA